MGIAPPIRIVSSYVGRLCEKGRLKIQSYHSLYSNNYFWRTIQKQEIDFIEESSGKISAYEFKWRSAGRNKIPTAFLENYLAEGTIIDKENFRTFVTPVIL